MSAVEKKTTIELEFNSTNYAAKVTLTRKGKTETILFELEKKEREDYGRNRETGPITFYFKGDRESLSELCTFLNQVLDKSREELAG